MDYYLLTIDGLVALDLRLRVAHPKLQTPSDAEVHLNVGIAELERTDDIHGVLGQTYREDHAQRAADFQRLIATLNHPITADGAEGEGFLDSTPRSYEASRVLAVDCAYTAFDRAMDSFRGGSKGATAAVAAAAERRGSLRQCKARSLFPPPCSLSLLHVPLPSSLFPFPPLLLRAMDSFKGGSKGATAVAAAAERRGSLRQRKVAADVVACTHPPTQAAAAQLEALESDYTGAAAARLEALESDYTGVDAAVDEDDDVFNAEEELVQEVPTRLRTSQASEPSGQEVNEAVIPFPPMPVRSIPRTRSLECPPGFAPAKRVSRPGKRRTRQAAAAVVSRASKRTPKTFAELLEEPCHQARPPYLTAAVEPGCCLCVLFVCSPLPCFSLTSMPTPHSPQANLETLPPGTPSYLTAAVGPPTAASVRRFCSACGSHAPYTCPRCAARFCCISCQRLHNETRCLKFVM
ncbi:unnamed protein product [Closterium sp. NIES-64]|nr:unnamed protein product [Closterium sp. NIES-64]